MERLNTHTQKPVRSEPSVLLRKAARRCDEATKFYDIMCLAITLTVMLPRMGSIMLFLALVLPPKVIDGSIR